MEPSDPPRREVSLEKGPAFYTDEGRGPAVVAIHGLPGSGRDFRWLAPHLTGGARVLRVDLPGFGATPVETAPDPSPEGRARFVFDLIDALEIERPVLLGHSMGGVVAGAAADIRPGAFRGLALLASPGLRDHAMFRWMPFGTLRRLLSHRWLGPALAPLNRRIFALAGFRGYPDSELRRTIDCVAQTSIGEHAARVRRLTLPTLVAWCDDDGVIRRDFAEELAAACPAGPRLRFERGGHNPQKTRAAEISRALIAWQSGML